ncbi:MAG: DinB family protein [Caldilineaceae bacterium]
MLAFDRVANKEVTLSDLVADLSVQDMHELTDEMVDTMLQLIDGCTDADVVFTPVDPKANDTFAENPEEVNIAWTLGHLIVHCTASSEEAAFLAAEMARGVENHGRSRYETPWEEVTTIAQCRARLEESRKMRHACLDIWPAEPNLTLTYQPWSSRPPINAVERFVSGLSHAHSHLAQIADVVAQARA